MKTLRTLLVVAAIFGAAVFCPPAIVRVDLRIGRPNYATATSRELPDSCGILATEALSRVAAGGSWARILHLTLVYHNYGAGHAVTAWSPPNCKRIYVYDQWLVRGTIELKTESRDSREISAALENAIAGLKISESHFWR